jgi:GT2 family glycosyltransferase
MCNLGVAAAHGDIVVLLDTAVEPIDPGWLTELVTHALRDEIGLVGALLYYPDETIQHAGVVLGLNGIADRPYIGYPRGFRGVDSRLLAVHSVTAMTTVCAAVRRDVFAQVGGLDERLAVAYQDIDLCLRVAELGLRNVLTPHAELYLHDPGSLDYHDGKSAGPQQRADELYFRTKWQDRAGRDPSYNVNLTRSGLAYALRLDEGPDSG